MPARQHVDRLRQAAPSVIPSLLMCDFANLGNEIQRLESAGVTALHLDVMDGHFVPNLSYGFPILEAIRRTTALALDVHLMITEPDKYVQRFCDSGADIITVHAEAVDDPTRLLAAIRDLGVAAGLAINPPTPLAAIERCLPYCDLVLIMSVMPGFGGQSFDSGALAKLCQLSSDPVRRFLIEIDGGVNDESIGACARAGIAQSPPAAWAG